MKGGTVVESIERVIAEHPFFAGVDQALLTQIVDSASHVKFDAGTYIFKEGDQANAFYLICDGRVALEIVAPGHKPIIVDTLEAGDTLGWSWLLSPFHWKFSAHAKTGVRAIALDAKSLRARCDENRNLGYEVLNRLTLIIERRGHTVPVAGYLRRPSIGLRMPNYGEDVQRHAFALESPRIEAGRSKTMRAAHIHPATAPAKRRV